MHMRKFLTMLGLSLAALAARGQYATDPYTATPQQVSDGLNETKPVTPYSLAQSGVLGQGGGSITNLPAYVVTNNQNSVTLGNVTVTNAYNLNNPALGETYSWSFNNSADLWLATDDGNTFVFSDAGNFKAQGNISTAQGEFTGNGGGLTNVPASQVTGTLPLAVLPGVVVTNSVIVDYYTNGTAYYFGSYHTNTLSAICAQFPWTEPTNTSSGVEIRFQPGDYYLTSAVILSNNFTLTGAGEYQTCLHFNPPTNTADAEFVQPTPGTSYNQGQLNLVVRDMSFEANTDYFGFIFDLTNNTSHFDRVGLFGPGQMTTGNTWELSGTGLTNAPALMGINQNALAGNYHTFVQCDFQGFADGILDQADWILIRDCSFGSISLVNGTVFTNKYPSGNTYHAGCALENTAGSLGLFSANNHFLNCYIGEYLGAGAPRNSG